MSQKEKKQECYANRELSWLKFNEREQDMDEKPFFCLPSFYRRFTKEDI